MSSDISIHETMRDYLMRDEKPPVPSFDNTPKRGGVRVVVSVDASLDGIERMSAAEAAELLGVSRPRITQIVNAGRLDGWREGRNLWVTKGSVEARRADRPAKAVVA